jgi:hypothetical protein
MAEIINLEERRHAHAADQALDTLIKILHGDGRFQTFDLAFNHYRRLVTPEKEEEK